MSKTHLANIISATINFFAGLYLYSITEDQTIIKLLPVFFAVMLVVLSQGVHYEQKSQTRISLALASLLQILLLGLITSSNTTEETILYATMIIPNFFAIYYLLKQNKRIQL